ncbi:MAG TPA: ADP-ribosylglycohydrolase family protein [Deltaproteobacteria bacterium]|nr:ADP-ribosylglycohydrolase family protein [Deltaproteobacteria bacterium]HQI81656.1 ADP-ribosylglycohydrolase family protein [Deltaproteobacteria bacterium]
MKDKAQACVLASFAGDALALGAHWIYDTDRIARDIGRMETYRDPAGDSYHPTKKKGEFTHYGDQALVLLESLAASRRFDAEDFSRRWQRLFDGYAGYRDQATRATLENLSQGKPFREAGSSSNDLSAAVRIAPLVYALRGDEEALVKAARVQASLTHTDGLTLDAAEFLARVALRVLGGAPPPAAVQEVLRDHFTGTAVEHAVHRGLDSCTQDSITAIKAFGQDCHSPHALPAVIHLVCSHEDDLRDALVTNVMAGGDSAARGMAVGMVLGAHLGMRAVPGEWMQGLKRRQQIEALLERIG